MTVYFKNQDKYGTAGRPGRPVECPTITKKNFPPDAKVTGNIVSMIKNDLHVTISSSKILHVVNSDGKTSFTKPKTCFDLTEGRGNARLSWVSKNAGYEIADWKTGIFGEEKK